MIKNCFNIIFLALILNKVECQNYGALPYLDNGIFPYYVESLLLDSIHDKLIVSSKYMKQAGGKTVRGVCSWNGSTWDSLSSGINTHNTLTNDPNGAILCGIPYNGKLLVGGYFQSIGGVNASNIALWNGTNWDSLPHRAFKFLNFNPTIYGFLKHNNLMYIYGQFDTIQGQKANGLATYNNTNFQAINLPFASPATITSMLVYKNELYVAGNFYKLGNPNIADIYKFDGVNWVDVGGSIKGTLSSVSSLVIYNNELYVGGFFSKSAGNVGNLLMKWDGINWIDAGWGDVLDNGAISKLLVHNNKLYAFSTSDYCSNMFCSKISVFDGVNWCSFKDTVDNAIFSAVVYHDTIHFAGAFKKINSDTSKKYIAKFINKNLLGACQPVTVRQESFNHTLFSIYPNPFNNHFNIKFDTFQNGSIIITNAFGQLIYSQQLNNQFTQVNLINHPPGIYFLKIEAENQIKVVKIIKQ